MFFFFRFFKVLVYFNQINFLVFFIKNFLIKKKTAHVQSKKEKKLNLLFLSIEMFRSDDEILSKNRNINLFSISEKWLNIFYAIFYGKSKENNSLRYAYSTNPPDFYIKKREKYQDFLNKVFESLLKKYKFDFIIGADYRYHSNIDWGIVAEKKKIKWVIFNRENLFACEKLYESLLNNRFAKLEYFPGTRIIVHNEITKKAFLESKFVKQSKKIKVLGCMRMDNLHKKLNQKDKQKKKKLVTLFSFKYKTLGRSYLSIFNKTHQAVVLFAKKNPEIDVVIKPKIEFVNKSLWYDFYQRAMSEISLNANEIKNLSILPDADPQDLILNSKFTIGLNSSVVLESAVSGIPVIIPYFNELRKKECENEIYFKGYLDCFDTPKSYKQLLEIMQMRLDNDKIPNRIQIKRLKLFESYMGKFDQRITERYIKELQSLRKAS